jgi:glutathione S-transferase
MAPPKIVLFRLKWSHYCEKISCALRAKNIPFEVVEIDISNPPKILRQARKTHGLKMIYPIIQVNDGEFVEDSTAILRRLDELAPQAPVFFPKGRDEEIQRLCIELDSSLGLAARRLGYGRCIAECPEVLSLLFIKPHHPWLHFFLWPLLSFWLSMTLTTRFRIFSSIEEGVFEWAAEIMTRCADLVKGRKGRYLFGDEMTAADITLSALMRPMRVLPAYAENPKFAEAYAFTARVMGELGAPRELLYESEVRRKRASILTPVAWTAVSLVFLPVVAVLRFLRTFVLVETPRAKKPTIVNTHFKKKSDNEPDNDQYVPPKQSWIKAAGTSLYNIFIRVPQQLTYRPKGL